MIATFRQSRLSGVLIYYLETERVKELLAILSGKY